VEIITFVFERGCLVVDGSLARLCLKHSLTQKLMRSQLAVAPDTTLF